MAVKNKLKEIKKTYKETSVEEFWIDGVLYNFLYGFLGALIIVSITIKIDVIVMMSYLLYYFYVGKIINRPKYTTDLGKFIVFPIPSALGAFVGYKLVPVLVGLI